MDKLKSSKNLLLSSMGNIPSITTPALNAIKSMKEQVIQNALLYAAVATTVASLALPMSANAAENTQNQLNLNLPAMVQMSYDENLPLSNLTDTKSELPIIQDNPWTPAEMAGEAAFLILMERDREQTLDIKNHPGIYETNVIMGSHPSGETINTYMIGMAIGHAVLANFLPHNYRSALIAAGVALELSVTDANVGLGLKSTF